MLEILRSKMQVSLPLVAKSLVQFCLLCLFWVYFGWPAIERYSAQKVMTITTVSPPSRDGLAPPAVTLCGRSTSTAVGWRGEGQRSKFNTNMNKGNLEKRCKKTLNMTACILGKTFTMSEVVGEVMVGGIGGGLTDPRFWTEDFTWTRDGRCYTLNYTQPLQGDPEKDALMFLNPNDAMYQIMFIHDPKLFVNSYNPKTLFMIRRKVMEDDFNLYPLSLVERVLLDRTQDPCNDDLTYSFLNCIRESFSRQVGCRLMWDGHSDQTRPICSHTQQYLDFEKLYEKLVDKTTSAIEETTEQR